MINFVFIIAFFIAQVILAWYFLSEGRSNKSVGDGPLIKDVSVIIPFKNEADRIGALLESINELDIPDGFKVEYIFIDDHSDDDTAQVIESSLEQQFQIILNDGKGKKEALRTAIGKAIYPNILSWDADIRVEASYFERLALLPEADLWILPVEMDGDELIQSLGAIEFSWLQILTFSEAQNKRAKLCNAANMLVKKTAYLETEKTRDDFEIGSGDDHFLLKELKKANKDIRAISDIDLTVSTPAPESFGQLLAQRKRWISKMSANDGASNIIALIALLILSFSNVLGFLLVGNAVLMLLVFFFKFVADYLVMKMYKRRALSTEESVHVLFHQFWYPVYLVALIFYQPRPKDRWTA
ncbi:MAG: glycosyltransferase involved in cell wall biosynthesis [Arenicella sp.]|jgi:glycosyltransferase involved in cell wall biosynthesis